MGLWWVVTLFVPLKYDLDRLICQVWVFDSCYGQWSDFISSTKIIRAGGMILRWVIRWANGMMISCMVGRAGSQTTRVSRFWRVRTRTATADGSVLLRDREFLYGLGVFGKEIVVWHETTVVPLEDIQVDDRLNYIERLVAILDRKVKNLRNKEVHLFKVWWEHRRGSEWT